tara:strand:- start:8214 stop:8846 length:633 start_codon:yes stop_codon:yes gene_type:complete
MKVLYSRVSSLQQNESRQIQNSDGFDYVLVDKCSGLIPLWERPKGSQLKKLMDKGELNHLEIHSIDRLGRSTLDVLSIWQELTNKKVTLVCRNPNIRNIDENGKEDKFSHLMMSILSTMADFERNLIRERQMEGIQLRKAKGLYSGRQIGTKESEEKFLSKPKNQKISEYLEKGYTFSEISKILKCSASTVNKVKQLTSTHMTNSSATPI